MVFSLLEAHKTNGVFLYISSELVVTVALEKNLVGLLHSSSAKKSNETIKSVLFQYNTNYLSSVVFQYITYFFYK